MNRKMRNEDEVPLNIVIRNLYRKEIVRRANDKMNRDVTIDAEVRIDSLLFGRDWDMKRIDYAKKKNRKHVVIDGRLIK